MTKNIESKDEQEPTLHPKNDPYGPVNAPNCVTIFGGGVTGLSAAHELVERGFRVQVWEPVHDDRDPSRGCDVGGLARTQWAAVPWAVDQEIFKRAPIASPSTRDTARITEEEAAAWKARATRPIRQLPWVVYLGGQKDRYPAIAAADETEFVFADTSKAAVNDLIRKAATEMLSRFGDPLDDTTVYCEVQHRVPLEAAGVDEARRVVKDFNDLIKGIGTLDLKEGEPPVYADQQTATLSGIGANEGRSVRLLITLLDGFPEWLPERVQVRVTYRVRERWIPGEHGFRVFPSFYHHLFDTMRRTPILESAPKSPIGAAQERSVTVNANNEKYVETGRTVFDNLRETTKQVIAAGKNVPPAVLPRSMPTSFEGVRDWLRLFLESPPQDSETNSQTGGGFGFTFRDLARFQLKVFQYLTSSDERRREYENMTWLEYLGGADKFSKACGEVLQKWPRALVAMDAATCDARTMGSAFMQLLLEDLQPPGFRDGTLTGPTSVAWLNPWRRYLEAQGVEFIHGKLVGFESMDSPGADAVKVIWPKVECYEPRYLSAADGSPALMPGYFLLALPDLEAKHMATEFRNAAREAGLPLTEGGDIQRTLKFFQEDEEAQLTREKPSGQLRHMIGIQYYFDADINWRDGHYYMPLSAWGLTAISQVRFWQDRHDWEHGYRGILSVVFTAMDEPGLGEMKTAWESPPHEIAWQVWKQVRDALVTENLPEPRYWHLDQNFKEDFDPPSSGIHKGYKNRNPLLVNVPGKWAERPGDLVEPPKGRLQKGGKISRYDVERGVVLAGTFMKTFTRLTTMEAANESARHAVNAIIQHAAHGEDAGTRLTPCDIWPIEQREVDDFQFFKELDAELYARKLEHFVEILDLDELKRTALRGSRSGTRDPFDPLSVLTQLDRLLRSYGSKMVDAIRRERTDQGDRP